VNHSLKQFGWFIRSLDENGNPWGDWRWQIDEPRANPAFAEWRPAFLGEEVPDRLIHVTDS